LEDNCSLRFFERLLLREIFKNLIFDVESEMNNLWIKISQLIGNPLFLIGTRKSLMRRLEEII